MSAQHPKLVETHRIGARTRERIVRVEQCPALRWHHIRHVGLAHAAEPYTIVRTNLSGAYLLACVSGEGRILLDGRWRPCREGQACLAPPHVLHAFHAIPRKRWEFCWVRYEQPADQRPFISASAPVLARFNSQPLFSAIEGLYEEVQASSDPVAIQHWVELIHRYVVRFSQPWHVDSRIWQLWNEVDKNLAEDWNVHKLSELAHFSSEHLRRLCQQQLGRSPMQQVTYLRMRHAARLLETTTEKIETIAAAVGYVNPFGFSNTFKKWIGWRPSEYRTGRAAKPLD